MDRVAPVLVLLLNRMLVGFAFLFGLAISLNGPTLPKAGVYLLTMTIWAIPDVIQVVRAPKASAQMHRIYSAVMHSIKAGYVALAVIILLTGIIRTMYADLSWGVVGFLATITVVTVEGIQLRRQLRNLAVLGQ